MKSIKLILFLAWRNVLRYRKRTIQSFLILFCGTFCVMLVDAYLKGYAASSSERIVSQCGILDVHAAGYLDSAEAMPLDLAIGDADGVMKKMMEAASGATTPGVHAILAPSIDTLCMLSNGEVSRAAPVLVTEAYARTASVMRAPVNPFLEDVPSTVLSGHFFRDASEAGALLDEKYARKLALAEGDSLILLGNDALGSFSMMEIPVIGIVREASLPGEAGCVVDIASFAPVFALEGMATSISMWFASGDGMKLEESDAEPMAVKKIMSALETDQGLEVRPFA